jgi:hypothetical protein
MRIDSIAWNSLNLANATSLEKELGQLARSPRQQQHELNWLRDGTFQLPPGEFIANLRSSDCPVSTPPILEFGVLDIQSNPTITPIARSNMPLSDGTVNGGVRLFQVHE